MATASPVLSPRVRFRDCTVQQHVSYTVTQQPFHLKIITAKGLLEEHSKVLQERRCYNYSANMPSLINKSSCTVSASRAPAVSLPATDGTGIRRVWISRINASTRRKRGLSLCTNISQRHMERERKSKRNKFWMHYNWIMPTTYPWSATWDQAGWSMGGADMQIARQGLKYTIVRIVQVEIAVCNHTYNVVRWRWQLCKQFQNSFRICQSLGSARNETLFQHSFTAYWSHHRQRRTRNDVYTNAPTALSRARVVYMGDGLCLRCTYDSCY